MRKASYFIWVFIITLIVIAAGIEYFPTDASHATSSNMAYMGIGAAIAMIFFIALFPLASLAYLLNWQALFKQTTSISKWRYVEAVLFFIPALLIGLLWAMEVWGKNEWVTLLAAASALPIIIFGAINFVYFIRNKNTRAGQTLTVIVCFIAPAMLVIIYLSINFAQQMQQKAEAKVQALNECNQHQKENILSQIEEQKNIIAQNATSEITSQYKKFPQRPIALSTSMSESALYGLNEKERANINIANTAWKLEIISRFQDLNPQLVLAGVSDKTGRIKADLKAYPEVRKALEQGRTLRLSNAVGSSLLELREINSGELILYGMGNSFKYAQPKFTCQDKAVLAS